MDRVIDAIPLLFAGMTQRNAEALRGLIALGGVNGTIDACKRAVAAKCTNANTILAWAEKSVAGKAAAKHQTKEAQKAVAGLVDN